MFAFYSMGYQMTLLCKSLIANITYMWLFLLMNCFEMSSQFTNSLTEAKFSNSINFVLFWFKDENIETFCYSLTQPCLNLEPWEGHVTHVQQWTKMGNLIHLIFGVKLWLDTKLYIPNTLNIDLILWHTQLIVCAENVKSGFKLWVFPFTFQAYIPLHTLNCMWVSLFKFHIWILEQF